MKSDQGYTLLELVAAISLLALLALPISASISTGLSSWSRLSAEVERIDEREQVLSAISSWLSASYPFDVDRNDELGSNPIEGEADWITFTAPVAPDPSNDSLFNVVLRHSPDSDGLLLGIKPDFVNGEVRELSDLQVIMLGVDSIQFEYLERTIDGNNWRGRWIDQRFLPEAIRYRITFSGSKNETVSRVVIPEVGYQAYCDFDEVSRNCRPGARVE